MVLLVVVAVTVTLVIGGITGLTHSRRRAAAAAARRAETEAAAQPSLAACRSWRADVERTVAEAIAEGRWISRDTVAGLQAARPEPSRPHSALAQDAVRGEDARAMLVALRGDLRTRVQTVNEQIRAAELVARREFLDTIEKQPLTNEQASAVLTFDNRVQVVAAAGSGKTSVMVARAAYSILRGFVPAERTLLLAFNKNAAVELQQRVDERLKAAGIDPAGLTASTFHAFGLSVIGRATGRKPRLASWLDGGRDVETVARIVDELRDRSPGFRFSWDLYRLLFARMGESPGDGDPDAYDHTSRTTGFRTFNGETVKSQGERMIADFLFLNGVKYEYEHPYSHDVADETHSQYRPDFYYPAADVWHEHWALDRDGNAPEEFHGYAAAMSWKRSLHEQHGTSLVETTWATIIDNTGFQPLANALKGHGIELDWNPDRPIPGAPPVEHQDLARLMRTFMTHVKSNSLTREDLERRLASAPPRVQVHRARVFLDLYWQIHAEWQRRLAADDSIDFEDMLVRAAEHLECGEVDMGLDLVLVDEFQDASHARARLAKALVDRPHRYLLAVGDDWQSVNRFAGADLSVMTDFSSWFGEGPTLRLQTTFRSPQSICDTASEFVARNPRQLEKTVRSIQPHHGPPVSLVRVRNEHEVQRAIAGVLEEIATRVGSRVIPPGPAGSVTADVLGRYRFDRDLMPRALPPELQVQFRTAHSSKGLEADYIIVPNVRSGTYGFPSEVVDDPVLSLAMAEADPYPHAEERRLFYVALTRARRRVILFGVQGQESAFVAELLANHRLELSPLSTVDLSEPCPTCGRGVLVTRKRRADGVEFLACSAFPRCRFTRRLTSTG